MDIVLILVLFVLALLLADNIRKPIARINFIEFGYIPYIDKGTDLHDGLNKKWALFLNGRVHWFKDFKEALEHSRSCYDPFFSIYKIEVMCRKGRVTTVNRINWDGMKSDLIHRIKYLT